MLPLSCPTAQEADKPVPTRIRREIFPGFTRAIVSIANFAVNIRLSEPLILVEDEQYWIDKLRPLLLLTSATLLGILVFAAALLFWPPRDPNRS